MLFRSFNELKIFESAKGQHNMITLLTRLNNEEFVAQTCITNRTGVADSKITNSILKWIDDKTDYYNVTQKELFENKENYIRIIGATKSRFGNPLQNALYKLKVQPDTLGRVCNIKQGIVSGADKVTDKHLKNYDIQAMKGAGIFILTKNELMSLELSKQEMKYVKNFYKNSQIHQYKILPNNNRFVIYITKESKIEEMPSILAHLKRFKSILQEKRECKNGRLPWYSLHWARDKTILEDIKIVNPRRSKLNKFAIENKGRYEQSDIMISTVKKEYKNILSIYYLLSLLNSKFYFTWLYYKGKRKGRMLEIGRAHV